MKRTASQPNQDASAKQPKGPKPIWSFFTNANTATRRSQITTVEDEILCVECRKFTWDANEPENRNIVDGCACDSHSSDAVFNLQGCLQRLNAFPSKTRCHQERFLLNKYYTKPCKCPLSVFSSKSDCIDNVSLEILKKFDPEKLAEFIPWCTVGDGNCLYRAVSLNLYGSQDYHLYLRVMTVLEMIENKDIYDSSSQSYIRILSEDIAFSELLKSVVSNGRYSELMHFYALSAAIGLPIYSYCPPSENISSLHPYTRCIYGRGLSVPVCTNGKTTDEDIQTILMWTMLHVPANRSAFRSDPNHIVLLQRKQSVSETVSTVEGRSPLQQFSEKSQTRCNNSHNKLSSVRSDQLRSLKSCQPSCGIETSVLCTDSESKPESDRQSKLKSMPRQSNVGVKKYNWLLKTDDGYLCSTCQKSGIASQQSNGSWVTIPIKCDSTRKAYKKAAKHAISSFHKLAEAGSSNCSSINEQLNLAAKKRSTSDDHCMKSVFRSAYFLYDSEIAHTTNWRTLLSTVASCDASGILKKYFEGLPDNAHHLSTTSATDVLDAFGVAIANGVQDRVRGCKEFAVMADESTSCNAQQMCSVCIRFFEDKQVKEVFLGCYPLQTTKALDVYKCISDALTAFGLDRTRIIAASFDGASNMSGQHGGVRALLKNDAPELIFVHCRSHVLQLALVRATNNTPEVKRIIGILNKIYSFYENSPLRLGILKTIEMAIDNETHKLIQACDTRWLSNAGSVRVIVRHYSAILLSLESIYVSAGDLSSDAGGLLLTLRKPSTLFLLTLLDMIFEPLAKLSKCLQTSQGNIAHAMCLAKAVTESIDSISLDEIGSSAATAMQKVVTSGGRMVPEEDLTLKEQQAIGKKYIQAIVQNLKLRFSDEVSELSTMQDVLVNKETNSDFSKIAKILHVSKAELDSEWAILRRLPGDLGCHKSILDLALSVDKQAMFPHFSTACRKLLLLPIGTATVERSFSTMNRILNSRRCRLNPYHTNQLMQLSIEGPGIPDVRAADEYVHATFSKLIDAAYAVWLSKPRRGVMNMSNEEDC